MTMTCEDWLRQENEQLQADLAAAQRELAAYRQAFAECRSELVGPNNLEPPHLYWIERRVAELLAQEGVPAQPQYREPTLEDARELKRVYGYSFYPIHMLECLKQLGFFRKVQP